MWEEPWPEPRPQAGGSHSVGQPRGARSFTGRVANGVGVAREPLRVQVPGLLGRPACSGLEVLVDGCHVQHHVLPVRPLRPHHLADVQRGFDADALSRLEGQREVPSL